MSLTGYRAAPPRETIARLLKKPKQARQRPRRRSIPSGGFLRRQPGRCPWVRAVCTNARLLWKGPRAIFSVFYDGQNALSRTQMSLARALLPELAQKPSFPAKETKGNAMDQSLKSPGQSALDDAFHAMFELSRTTPAPTLSQRLDRLARLRAVIADNE